MRYLPPILRGSGPGGRSPGQIVLVVILVAVALIVYTGGGDPASLARGARDLAFLFPALVLSLSVHELAHAYIATTLGDPTARNAGRLTLDPRAHLDPLGTFMLILTVLLGFGIGWAKPVPVNPWRLRVGPRVGMALVAIAGPLSNLLIAFVALQLGDLVAGTGVLPRDLLGLFGALAFMNVALAIFNMIPIPPLDGFRVLVGVVPGPWATGLSQLEPYGPMLLMLLVFMGGGLLRGLIQGVGVPLFRMLGA